MEWFDDPILCIRYTLVYYLLLTYFLLLLYDCVDPHFSRAPPLDRRDSLFICEKLILEKVGVATYFIFILKGKNKTRKKNPKM